LVKKNLEPGGHVPRNKTRKTAKKPESCYWGQRRSTVQQAPDSGEKGQSPPK